MRIYSWLRPKSREEEIDEVVEELTKNVGQWALVGKGLSMKDMIRDRDELVSRRASVWPQMADPDRFIYDLYARMMP